MTTKEKECVIGKYIDYIINEENIWDPSKYIQCQNVRGVFKDTDVNFNYQYCFGSSFMEGSIGEYGVRVFYTRYQGFRIYLWPLKYGLAKDAKPACFNFGAKDAVIKFLDENATWGV